MLSEAQREPLLRLDQEKLAALKRSVMWDVDLGALEDDAHAPKEMLGKLNSSPMILLWHYDRV